MGWLGKLFGGGGGRASTPQQFWAWFAKNASRFEGPPEQAPTEDLANQLRGIDERLAMVFGGVRGGGAHELEISCEGSRELIPLVKHIVAEAPAIPGWRIFA